MELKTSKAQRSATKRILIMGMVSTCLVVLAATQNSETLQNVKAKILQQTLGKFTLERIEWRELNSTNLSPLVKEDGLWKASGLKKGQPLIGIDLGELEEKLLLIPWIESVSIQKHFSYGISVQYQTHAAKAIVSKNNKPWLLSSAGNWIAPLGLSNNAYAVDLPFLTGFENPSQALEWLELFENTLNAGNLKGRAQVHEISKTNQDVKAILEVRYSSQPMKLSIQLSTAQDLNSGEKEKELSRLKKTVQYLIKNNILVSSIDLRAGQKVVVNVGKRL